MSQLRSTDVVARLSDVQGKDVVAELLDEDAVINSGTASASNETQTGGRSPASEANEDAVEDYDSIRLNPDHHVDNSRKSLDDAYRPAHARSGSRQESEGLAISTPSTGSQKNKGGLEVRLERTDKKGRYLLTVDDPETKALLRREIDRANGKKVRSRMRIRELVFTRQFTTFDRQNPTNEKSPFFGFFTLFWICMGFMVVKSAMKNYRAFGNILGRNELAQLMFQRDVAVMGLTDGAMFLGTFEGWLMQNLVQKRWINWASTGWIIQNIWQTAYLGAFVGWTYYRDWPWSHSIFITLHCLVFLMKMHSYSFYNGYLSSVTLRKELLEKKLKQLEAMEPLQSPPTSPIREQSVATGFDSNNLTAHRRPSAQHRTSTNFQAEPTEVAAVASAIESGQPVSPEQVQVFSSIIKNEIDELAAELRGKSGDGKTAYPKNLTLVNHAEYICLPTLVYELDYPRQESTNWWYVAEKSFATFGILIIMQVISQAFIYPLVMQTVQMKEAGMSIDQRWQEFPYIVGDMLFPMLLEQLLTWYLIWECILNVLAEVFKFAYVTYFPTPLHTILIFLRNIK
jgi:sterol O-acyltransferase